MTEKLKFENSNELSSNELKELQNFKESDLDNLDKKQLEDLKKALIAEKQGYLERSKNKASKEWVSSLIDRVINAIDRRLANVSNTKDKKEFNEVKDNKVESQKLEEELQKLEEKYDIKISKEGVMYVVNGAKDESLNGTYSDLQAIEDRFSSKKVHKANESGKVSVTVNIPDDYEKKDDIKENKNDVKLEKSVKERESLNASLSEEVFNSRLEKLLNPDTTLVFKIGDKAIVMEFDNAAQKKEAEKLFLSLEKNFDNDKMAAYAVISFLSKYKDNLKSVQEIYKEAAKGLYGNQIVIAEDNSMDFALLDAARKKDVKVIEVDTGNKFLNALGNTFTLGLIGVDTANVSKDVLENGDYGRKATSTDLWKGWYKIVSNDKDGKDVTYSHEKSVSDFNADIIPLQEPLKHYTEKEIISSLAQKMENILHDDNKLQKIFSKEQKHEKLSLEEQLVIDYLKSYGIDAKQLIAIDLKESFIQDSAIKKWLESNKVVDKLTSKQVAVEITQDGFFKVNPDAFNDKNAKFVKVKLDGVDVGDKKEDKEVLMEVAKASYKDLMGEQPQELYEKLSNLPPIVLKDGSIIGFTKEGMYVLGKDLGDGADAVKDFLRRHEFAAAMVATSIFTTLAVLTILDKINYEGIGEFFQNIGKGVSHGLEHLGKLFKKGGRKLIDDIKSLKIDISRLEAFGLGYLVTALPLNYQIELWKEKYAKLYGDVKGAPSIDAELADATGEKVKLPSDEEIKEYVEAKNKFAHAVLTKLGIFEPGQATDVDYDVEVGGNGKYSILIHGRGEEAGSIIKLGDKTLYVDEGDTLEFDVKKNDDGTFTLQGINGEIKIDTFGKDDYVDFNGKEATYYEARTIGSDKKKNTINIEGKSFEEIYKELTEEKKDKKDKSEKGNE